MGRSQTNPMKPKEVLGVDLKADEGFKIVS